jgi:hypothetical protein
MKRWAIVEVPEDIEPNDKYEILGFGGRYEKVLNGPVELVQKAHEVAGVEWRLPKRGEWFFSAIDNVWRRARIDFGGMAGDYPKPVIPADPEPCENCQNVKNGGIRYKYASPNPMDFDRLCAVCGRPESEWTYAPDIEWGGIGSGLL